MKYAAIDVGSNSCRLLVAEIVDGKIRTLYQELNSTRISEGLNMSGRLGAEAMERTRSCLREYRQQLDRLKVERWRAVATSAVREAENRDEFTARVADECDLVVEVISGEEEARLSYQGVQEGLTLEWAPLMVDLGGGSCEFRLEENGGCFSLSLPLGAVRATEAAFGIMKIKSILAPVAAVADGFREHALVFVGGTATTLAAMKLSLDTYDPEQVHGQVLRREEVADLYNMLISMPLGLRRRLPGLQPERADIIPAGAMIVLLIMDILGHDLITVSEADILHGIIRILHSEVTHPDD